jgi:hypothetical protein
MINQISKKKKKNKKIHSSTENNKVTMPDSRLMNLLKNNLMRVITINKSHNQRINWRRKR